MKITLYVSDHCESCEQVLQYFKEKDLAYEVIDVTYDQEMFDRMLSEGGIATPFIVIEGRAFHMFDRDKIEDFLHTLTNGIAMKN
jgi:arsenate reductase-like glutaredoxin family protein